MSTITSAAAFRALLQSNPERAKQWVERTAKHVDGVVPAADQRALAQLVALSTDAFVAQAGPKVDALFAVTAPPTTDQPLDLPVVHGTLTVDRGSRVQKGDQGYREWPDLKLTLTLADGRTLSLSSDHEKKDETFKFIGGTDVMAFAGQPVSVRGVVDETGKTLRVTEFAPGTLPDFVTGRVVVENDKVFVRARSRGLIEVTNPEFAAELKTRNKMGVILEGDTVEHTHGDGTVSRTFDGHPDGYWMLVRFTAALRHETNEVVSGTIQTAGSTARARVDMPVTEGAKVEVGDRMYVRGRYKDGVITAEKATSSAGSPWPTASAQRGPALKSVIDFIDPADV